MNMFDIMITCHGIDMSDLYGGDITNWDNTVRIGLFCLADLRAWI